MRNARMTIWVMVLFSGLCQGVIDITFTEDGIIQEGDIYNDVDVYGDTTTVDMTGGQVVTLSAFDQSITNISDGLVMTSSSHDQSTINISGGLVHAMNINDGGNTVNMTGGEVWNLIVVDGVFNMWGGGITGVPIVAHATRGAIINIYGYDFSTESNGPYLTGFWQDGTQIGLNFDPNANAYDAVVLHEIPEPTTLLLLGLGGLALRKRR